MKSTHKLQSELQFHVLLETTIAEAWQVIEPVGRANPVSTLTLQACNLLSLPPSAASVWGWVGIMQSKSCYRFRNTYDSPSVYSHFCPILLRQGFDITRVVLSRIWGEVGWKSDGSHGFARSMVDGKKSVDRWPIKCLSFASVGNITHTVKTVASGHPDS